MARWSAARNFQSQARYSFTEAYRYLPHGSSVLKGLMNFSSQVWALGANKILYIPVLLEQSMQITEVWWQNGTTVSGNVDCGVYTDNGIRLGNAGTTVQAGISAVQSVSTSFLAPRGVLYMALAVSSGTATFYALADVGHPDWIGFMLEQSAAPPLPTSAIFATAAGGYLPAFGFTGRLL
jgi:hypothetical protein